MWGLNFCALSMGKKPEIKNMYYLYEALARITSSEPEMEENLKNEKP